jgi:TPR repeat protein
LLARLIQPQDLTATACDATIAKSRDRWSKSAASRLTIAAMIVAVAQYILGTTLYQVGLGVPKDHAEALKLARRAAEQDDMTGEYVLGTARGRIFNQPTALC